MRLVWIVGDEKMIDEKTKTKTVCDLLCCYLACSMKSARVKMVMVRKSEMSNNRKREKSKQRKFE